MEEIIKILQNIFSKGLEYFGRYYSSYRGFVISREDPEGYGRIQVKVPKVYGHQVMEYWAWQKGCYSGKDHGAQVIPSVGDVVWIEFEMGDVRYPIWTYGHFSRVNDEKEKPEELKDPDIYWFKTPKGQLVELNDTEDLIRFTHSSGHTFIIDADGVHYAADQYRFGEENLEPGVLGTKNIDSQTAILDALKNLVTTLKTNATTDATMAGTLGLAGIVALPAALTILETSMATIQPKIDATTSSKLSLE